MTPPLLNALFPPVSRTYTGSRWSLYFLVGAALISTARSLVHLFVPDGGANSIAGIDIAMAGGVNIVAMFAQWGASQLVLSVMQWLVIWRYRFLVPAMLWVLVIEQLLRLTAGLLKPLQIAAAPPGSYSTYAFLGLGLVFLVLSLQDVQAKKTRR